MHPANAPSRASETRRVRAQLDAHLRWIHGWPLAVEGGGVRWQIVPPPGYRPEVVLLDAEALGRASRAWAKATGEHRRSFERAVPDPAAWSAVAPLRLRQLREGLEGRIPPPPDASSAIELAFAVRPERAAARAFADRAGLPEEPVLAVVLAWLHARHGDAAQPLVDLLRGPEPRLSDEGTKAELEAALSRGAAPVLPEAASWRATLREWTLGLAGLRDGPRALALGWLPAALPAESIAAWQGWWEVTARAARAVSSAAAAQGPGALPQRAAATRALAALPKPPVPLAPARTLAAAQVLARSGLRPTGGLARFGAGAGAMVERWAAEVQRPGAARLLRHIEVDLAAGRVTPDQVPVEGELLEGRDPVGSWKIGVALLVDGVALGPRGWQFLVAVHDLHPPTAAARTRAAMAKGWDHWPWERALRHAHRAETGDPARFVKLAQLLHDGRDLHEVVGVLGARLPHAVRVVGRAPLVEAGTRMKLLRGFGGTVPPFPGGRAELPTALARAPEVLHDALRDLAAVHPEPVRAARAVLDRDLPPPEHLLGQIEALSSRTLPAASERVERLRARLAAPPALGAGRLANLDAKLRDAALRAACEGWRDALAVAVRETVKARFGVDPALLDRRGVRILAGVAELAPPYRALVERLLAKRAGPPPWDLRDDPVHVAWRRRMEARGLTLAPWLDPPTLEIGGLLLELARDPLDVLWMGGPFDTCLSPDGVNFFSAVVNASDPDKRVLFARRHGEIVGRCLFALTEEGGLLTFHVYGEIPPQPVAAFAEALAAAMHTVVVPWGTVLPRLATEWYDDGPRDLTRRFRFLAPGDPWFVAHRDDSPEAFVCALAAAMAPIPLGPVLMPVVLASAAVDAHPERVLSLLPYLGPDTDLDTRNRAAALLLAARRGDLAWSLFGDAIAARLAKQAADGRSQPDRSLAWLWIHCDPLRALRAFRGRADLARLHAHALEVLGRPAQAARIRERGAS